MNTALRRYSLILSVLAGVVLGLIGGPVWILLIWGAVGIALGYLGLSRKAGLLNGVVFGFVVSFVFMLHGYNGTDPVATKLAPFAALGLFGAFCGLILAVVGRLGRRRDRGEPPPDNHV